MNDTAPRPFGHHQEDAPEASEESLGTLIVRVWKSPETDELRARLVETGSNSPVTWATAAGVDTICDAVRTWLELRRGPPADGRR